MASKTILRISLTGIIVVAACLFLLSSFYTASPSLPGTCKESIDECSKKTGSGDTNTDLDLESLSGKFFSSASY